LIAEKQRTLSDQISKAVSAESSAIDRAAARRGSAISSRLPDQIYPLLIYCAAHNK
jgi:hypothetical protein